MMLWFLRKDNLDLYYFWRTGHWFLSVDSRYRPSRLRGYARNIMMRNGFYLRNMWMVLATHRRDIIHLRRIGDALIHTNGNLELYCFWRTGHWFLSVNSGYRFRIFTLICSEHYEEEFLYPSKIIFVDLSFGYQRIYEQHCPLRFHKWSEERSWIELQIAPASSVLSNVKRLVFSDVVPDDLSYVVLLDLISWWDVELYEWGICESPMNR